MTARETPATARRRHKGHFDHRCHLGHRCHLERGAAAVEMALVMPLLILMVMGIIDFGRIFNGEIQLSQAAREGARVAALGFSVDEVKTRTGAALNNPAFQGGTPTISVAVLGPSGAPIGGRTVCDPTLASDVADNSAEVTVKISYNKILFGPTELSQKAVMKCSG